MIRTHDGQRGGTDGAGGVAVSGRPPHLHRIESDVRLAAPLESVFAFFSDAANLELLTPGWLHFRILSPLPLAMAVGTRIDYRLRLRGVPIRWQSEITAWEPPCRFVDEQRRGPYRVWIHEHRFAEEHREGREPVVWPATGSTTRCPVGAWSTGCWWRATCAASSHSAATG